MSEKKEYGWLKDRYTALMGRPPEEKELDRLMKVKDLLGIDYDDPVMLQLLALEYYGQLYEQVPEKINTVIAQTEAHASKHFEQQAAAIAQQQVKVISQQGSDALDALYKAANAMIAQTGEKGKESISTFILNDFAKATGPAFFNAQNSVELAVREIFEFGKRQTRRMLLHSAIAGLVSGMVVLAVAYWMWGRA